MKKKKSKVKASSKKAQMQSAGKRAMSSKKVSAKASTKNASRTNKSTKKVSAKSQRLEAPIKSGIPKKRMADQPISAKQNREQSAKQNSEDIIQLCLKDHVALKELIEVMKDDEAEETAKEEAFEKFAKLLKRHAKPEEQTLYVRMKEDEELRADGFEGDTEHAIADQLIKEINGVKDDDVWCAKVKVLAELVEHHIEEEEEEMFPECEESIKASERTQLGNQYLLLQAQYENPDEDTEETPEKLSADAAEDEDYEHKDAEVVEEEDDDTEDDSPSHHA